MLRHDAVVIAEQAEAILKEPWRYSEYDVETPKKENGGKLTLQLLYGSEDAPQFDDLTMLGIKWLGPSH